MVKRKRKRKASAFAMRVGRNRRSGMSFKAAVRAAKGGSTTRSRRKVSRKRKVNIVRVRSVSMARRKRRSSRRSSRSIIPGFGKVGSIVKNVGLAFAIGLGVSTAANAVADNFNIPQARQFGNVAAAFGAATAAPGIAGLGAAAAFLLSGTGGGGAAPSGTGAFV